MEILEKVTKLDQQLSYMKKFGIIVSDYEKLDSFFKDLDNVYKLLKRFEEDYGIPSDDIRGWIEGKYLDEAYKLLSKEADNIRRKYEDLQRRWEDLLGILGGLGMKIAAEPPKGLLNMEKEVKHLEEELRRRLGKPALELLKFFRYELKHPPDLSREELIEALIKIRPLIRIRRGSEK